MTTPNLNLEAVRFDLPADANMILGQSHFIKTAEDLYEALVNAVPGITCTNARGAFYLFPNISRLGPMMTWSTTSSPISHPARTRREVNFTSASLGSRLPLGWSTTHDRSFPAG